MPYILLHTYAIYIPYGYLYYLYNCYTTYGINNDFMYCGLFILVTRPFFYNGPQCAIGVRQNSWTQQHTFYQHIHCRIESIMFSVFDQPTNPGTYSRRERVAACFFFHGSEVCYLHIVQKVTWYVKWISTLTSSRQFQCKIQIQTLTHFLIWFSIYTPSLWGCFSDRYHVTYWVYLTLFSFKLWFFQLHICQTLLTCSEIMSICHLSVEKKTVHVDKRSIFNHIWGV